MKRKDQNDVSSVTECDDKANNFLSKRRRDLC